MSLNWAALLPLGIAKTFTEQAVPSGGISGVLLAMRGLVRRGVPMPTAMAIMLVAMSRPTPPIWPRCSGLWPS